MALLDSILDRNTTNQPFSYPSGVVLVFLLMAIIFGGLIGVGLVQFISSLKGINFAVVLESLNENSPRADRDFVRLANFISQLFTFTIPALLVVLFLFREHWLSYLKLNQKPILTNIGLGILFILTAFPLAQFAMWINQQIPLPEWMIAKEGAATEMIKGLLTMHSPVEFFFTIFVVAVLPAIGEELVFRGILQQQLEKKTNPILAIWVTAIIFSAIHMQFEGFLARMLLGAILCYLFYWTRNLWVPIIAHFIFNAVQIIAHYSTNGALAEAELNNLEAPQIGIIILSTFALFYLGRTLENRNHQSSTSSEDLDLNV